MFVSNPPVHHFGISWRKNITKIENFRECLSIYGLYESNSPRGQIIYAMYSGDYKLFFESLGWSHMASELHLLSSGNIVDAYAKNNAVRSRLHRLDLWEYFFLAAHSREISHYILWFLNFNSSPAFLFARNTKAENDNILYKTTHVRFVEKLLENKNYYPLHKIHTGTISNWIFDVAVANNNINLAIEFQEHIKFVDIRTLICMCSKSIDFLTLVLKKYDKKLIFRHLKRIVCHVVNNNCDNESFALLQKLFGCCCGNVKNQIALDHNLLHADTRLISVRCPKCNNTGYENGDAAKDLNY
jgi:hypothetical protein